LTTAGDDAAAVAVVAGTDRPRRRPAVGAPEARGVELEDHAAEVRREVAGTVAVAFRAEREAEAHVEPAAPVQVGDPEHDERHPWLPTPRRRHDGRMV
jgi:hypothetical protein